MFGFPLPLYDSGSSGVKLTNNADSGFPKPIIGETFYSIKSGNWTDATVWQTASGRVGLLPTSNDDVYIRHSINTNFTANTTTTINNLYVSVNGIIVMTGGGGTVSLAILGNFQCQGLFNGSGGQSHNIYLYGTNNRIDNYLFSASTNIVYAGNTNQNILNLNYYNLSLDGFGTKYLTADTILLGNYQPIVFVASAAPILECGAFNFTVNGTSVIRGGFSKNNSGSLLFIGNIGVVNPSNTIGFNLSGNPSVEFRGGLTLDNVLNSSQFYTGTGTWSFTTNNQTLQSRFSSTTMSFDCPIIIGSGVTLTVNSATTTNVIALNNTINGTDGTSKLLMGGTGALNFATAASCGSMTTGTYDFTTNANTVQFNGNYSATIPTLFTTFSSLTIGGTGTKTLGVNTTVNASLNNNGIFELSTYNLIVNGQTNLNAATTLSKSGGGNVLFVGTILVGGNNPLLNFSGNPTVELRNGINSSSYTWNTFNTGTSQWTFSTNNQQIQCSYGGLLTFNCPVLISGAITLGISGIAFNFGGIILNSTINGDNVNSKLLVGGSSAAFPSILGITNTSPIMSTGIFDFTSSVYSVISYRISGNYTIPYSSFQGLDIAATGTKTLSVNTTILTTLSVSNGALECSTYNLSITGATSVSNVGFIRKNSATGNIIFIGNLNISTNTGGLDFSVGNPNIELRNGINMGGYSPSISTGTGIWTFSTNSQSISGYGNNTFNCPITISGAINLTVTFNLAQSIFNGTINGDNVNSKLICGASNQLNYRSTTQPMATGILDTSTNLNTWIYGSGNQNIKGGPSLVAKQVYRNLTLNGGGTKTLQGYVSVLNTYTLTSPATLALNGFTLTNP